MIVTTVTLTIPEAALEAAEALLTANRACNAADGGYASGAEDTPYTTSATALMVTLAAMISPDQYDEKAVAFGQWVRDECISNGENVTYQITDVLGWTIELSPSYDGDAPPKVLLGKGTGHYASLIPMILGGERT